MEIILKITVNPNGLSAVDVADELISNIYDANDLFTVENVQDLSE